MTAGLGQSSVPHSCYKGIKLALRPPEGVEVDRADDACTSARAVILPDQPLIGSKLGRQDEAARPEHLVREVPPADKRHQTQG